jgi:monoamine oxidase
VRENSVLIIGAGAAGLAAAETLARAGRRVTLLEGRRRTGGRIHTILAQGGKVPVELGAEFVHGEKVCTWEIIRAAKLRTHRMPDRHWRFTNGALVEDPSFYKELDHVLGKINPAGPDRDAQSFLAQAEGLSDSARRLATDYVEGFHAAPASRMSIHALAKAEEAAEQEEGMGQFRLAKGYSVLLQLFGERLPALGAEIHLNTVVKAVSWKPGHVEVVAQTPTGRHSFHAPQAIVTLPLGVLQTQGPEAVVFEPGLGDKEEAIQGLAMGAVVKLTLQFRSRFWPVENFGFIHADEAELFTWWSDERGPVLIGWSGGPRAERLNRAGRDSLVAEALRTLARLFQVEPARIQDLLVATFTHDWVNDPFARGAYSYPPVGMGNMPRVLAAPLAGTLFFAGEATSALGDLGTVHGAFASGRRAAQELLAGEPKTG